MLHFGSDQSKISEIHPKIEKITKKTSTKFQSTISNAPKLDQNVKNTEKSKRYINNAKKTAYFAKNTVLEPTKIARNSRFPLKIVKFSHEKYQTHVENASKQC